CATSRLPGAVELSALTTFCSPWHHGGPPPTSAVVRGEREGTGLERKESSDPSRRQSSGRLARGENSDKRTRSPSVGRESPQQNRRRKAHPLDRTLGIDVPPVSIRQPNGFSPLVPPRGVEREAAVKISCPSCSAKYSIADEKVQNRLAKIRCRKCGTSIVIDGNVSPAAVFAGEPEADGARPAAGLAGAAQPAAAASSTVFTGDFGENDQRQMTVSEVVAAYNAGQVTGETYLWADGFADWTPLAQIEEVVAALNAAAGIDETSAAGASTAPSETPWADSAATRAQATPAAAPVAARDRKSTRLN